ncbi:ABC transporter ATP-binding protein [Thermus sp. FJN-A]
MDGLEARGVVGPYALQGVDLALRPGEWVALLGPNGSGKSTLLRVLAGLLRPKEGEVFLEGRPLRAYGSYHRGRLLGYLPQNGPYPEGLWAEEVVRLGRLPHQGLWGQERREDREAVEWALEVTGTSPLRRRTLATLSGGERQRVLLARALAGRPKYLLLDEPTTFLDLEHQGEVVALLRRLSGLGVGVLSVLHDPNQAALAHRVAVLEGGRLLAEGPPGAVLLEAFLQRLYGPRVRVAKLEGNRPHVYLDG